MGKVVIISGTPKSTSRLTGVVGQAIQELEQKGVQVDLIPVYEMPPEDLLLANFGSPAIKRAHALVAEADALIIATPVFKASYSGVLKAYLDLLPEKSLQNKIILPLAMGGTTAHLLMLEYALKPVLSVLGVTQFEQGVFVQDSNVKWNNTGTVDIEPSVHERFSNSLTLLSQNIANKALVG